MLLPADVSTFFSLRLPMPVPPGRRLDIFLSTSAYAGSSRQTFGHFSLYVCPCQFLPADVWTLFSLRLPMPVLPGRRLDTFLSTSAYAGSSRQTFGHFSLCVCLCSLLSADVWTFFSLRLPMRVPPGRRFGFFFSTSALSSSVPVKFIMMNASSSFFWYTIIDISLKHRPAAYFRKGGISS